MQKYSNKNQLVYEFFSIKFVVYKRFSNLKRFLSKLMVKFKPQRAQIFENFPWDYLFLPWNLSLVIHGILT